MERVGMVGSSGDTTAFVAPVRRMCAMTRHNQVAARSTFNVHDAFVYPNT